MKALETNQLWQLSWLRLKGFLREPEQLFGLFVMPIILSLVLALAFGAKEIGELAVAIETGAEGDALAAAVAESTDVKARRVTREEGYDLLRRGLVAAVVLPGSPPGIVVDPTREEGRSARLALNVALLGTPRQQAPQLRQENAEKQMGTRFIDFFIPGLLGISILATGLHMIGYPLASMRMLKLLKNYNATPMNGGYFLLSFVFTRAVLGAVEIAFFVAFGRLFYSVEIHGSLIDYFAFGLFGTIMLAGLALLVGSRAQTSDTAQGLGQAAYMSAALLSGVFFSAESFPTWLQPVIQLLPVTAFIEGLRAIAIHGASLASLTKELLILGITGLVCFATALKIFRWQ